MAVCILQPFLLNLNDLINIAVSKEIPLTVHLGSRVKQVIIVQYSTQKGCDINATNNVAFPMCMWEVLLLNDIKCVNITMKCP